VVVDGADAVVDRAGPEPPSAWTTGTRISVAALTAQAIPREVVT